MITDGWKGYSPLENEFEIRQKPSQGGETFPGLCGIHEFKRLRGIHHHCSARCFNGFLNEFFFRFNRRIDLTGIWHKLIERFITNPHYRYKANET